LIGIALSGDSPAGKSVGVVPFFRLIQIEADRQRFSGGAWWRKIMLFLQLSDCVSSFSPAGAYHLQDDRPDGTARAESAVGRTN
jgi:hypothetical protein